jgi:hypothetical protein
LIRIGQSAAVVNGVGNRGVALPGLGNAGARDIHAADRADDGRQERMVIADAATDIEQTDLARGLEIRDNRLQQVARLGPGERLDLLTRERDRAIDRLVIRLVVLVKFFGYRLLLRIHLVLETPL